MADNNPQDITRPSLRREAATVTHDDIDTVIMQGITFRGAGKGSTKDNGNKVKTKAKKKGYVTGSHGSASAKKKADIRRARANRHK
ncbi:MAG: hypothetical protein J6W75_07540 [Bacteroidaceae bacterium]|nr:hypothetical protein [Bacteroidaceae bacterium]